MGKKGVEEMIDQIEIFIENCKYQPLSQTKIVFHKEELESSGSARSVFPSDNAQ